MKSIFFKLLFAGFLFLFSDANLIAQNNYEDSVAERLGDLTEAETESDTILNKHQYVLEDDSMRQYKNDRDFAYMKYLDSLLRKTNDLKVDTFSMNNADGVKRKKSNSQTPKPINRNKSNVLNQPFIKVILWVLAIAFIVFVLYKLFLGENFFKRNQAYKNISEAQPEEETISDVFAYDTLISQAVQSKNFRLAIRYLYLQTVHRLSDAGVIELSADKTNYQYVNELQGKSYQYDFASVTLNYEYVWYGKFDISEETFNKLNKDFKTFNQKL